MTTTTICAIAAVWILGAVYTHGVGWRNAYRRDADTYWSPVGLVLIFVLWPFLLASYLFANDEDR